jgi:5-methyltetrahydrofolate--homocysteine methyltransferase
MEQKVILLDGATGTSLWKKASDKQPVWKYNIENPEIVVELEKEYIAAGSQIIETNTFAANRSFVIVWLAWFRRRFVCLTRRWRVPM